MAEADDTRAVILNGAEKAGETAQFIEKTRLTGNKIGSGLNTVKADIDQAMRELLVSLAKIRDAKALLSPHLAGSGVGFVANAMMYMQRVEDELQETMQKLMHMKNDIEGWQREIIPVLDRDLGEQAGKVRTAAGELRTYANVL